MKRWRPRSTTDSWGAPKPTTLKMPGDIKAMQSVAGTLYVWTDRGVFSVRHVPPRWWHRLGWALLRAWYRITAIGGP